MRCPKCGYITFDRVERCGKCAHDLMAVAAQLRGPMAKVAPPMFLGALVSAAAAEVAEAEPAEFDLSEEALDLGAAEEESLALAEEEAPQSQAAEEETAIEMPSLSGLDLSGLMPSDEEAQAAAPAETPEGEIGGLVMPETDLEEAPQSQAAAASDDLSFNFDLTGGEGRGETELEAEEEAAGGVLDLADLLGAVPEAPATEEPAAADDEADDLSLLLEDAPAAAASPGHPEQISLSLESSASDEDLDLTFDDAQTVPAEADAAGHAGHPDIPDLGLTLESDGEEEETAP
ncbi:MAG: hypothetical protein AB1413_06290 [Thermodesulfobacteriota bacterium]